MQQSQFSTRFTQEDKRWLLGDADLGSVLAPFTAGLATPVSLDAVPEPPSELSLALASASQEMRLLGLEQVRLRESVETLTSTLFINANALSPKEADATTAALKAEAKEPPSGPVASFAKSAWDQLWDSAKSKVAEKLIDVAVDSIGKLFKGRKKSGGRSSLFRSLSESAGKVLGGSPMGFHSGSSPQSVQSFASASNVAPTPTASDVPGGVFADIFAKLESIGGRRLAPLRTAGAALDVIQGVRNGDTNAVGAGLSTSGGAWGGAYAGAAVGTMILPGVGTAVGGAIGGLLGGEVGAWFGNQVFGSSDRLPAPGAVSKDLNAARTDNVQVSIAPSIQITGVNPADAQQVVNQVIQALQFQCMPMVTDSLGIRRNTAMTDPPGGD